MTSLLQAPLSVQKSSKQHSASAPSHNNPPICDVMPPSTVPAIPPASLLGPALPSPPAVPHPSCSTSRSSRPWEPRTVASCFTSCWRVGCRSSKWRGLSRRNACMCPSRLITNVPTNEDMPSRSGCWGLKGDRGKRHGRRTWECSRICDARICDANKWWVGYRRLPIASHACGDHTLPYRMRACHLAITILADQPGL